MPLALIIVGAVMIVSAVRGTTAQLGAQLKQDFSGNSSFLKWAAAILFIGIVGYYAPAKKFSYAFLALILIGMILSNRGIFAQLQSALANIKPATPAPSTTAGLNQPGASFASAQASPFGSLPSTVSGSPFGNLAGAINSFGTADLFSNVMGALGA